MLYIIKQLFTVESLDMSLYPVLSTISCWISWYIQWRNTKQLYFYWTSRKNIKKKLQEVEKAKEEEGVPDDEGWITVTRHGKTKTTPFTEAHKKHLTQKEKKKRKEKVHNKTNKMICVLSEDADQPGHLQGLISLHCVLNV